MTNGDKIRALDDENLACVLGMLPFTPPNRSCRKMFSEPCMLNIATGTTCNQCWLEWLQSDDSDRSDEDKDLKGKNE